MPLPSDLDLDIAPGSNVLLKAPTFHTDRDTVCGQLLTDSTGYGVVGVSLTKPANTWFGRVSPYFSPSPRGEVVIVTSDPMRGSKLQDQAATADCIKTVDDIRNFTQLGVRITEAINTISTPEITVRLCFETITALFQDQDTDTVFRFLHLVTNQLTAVDGIGHYHLDPAAHDESTISALVPLFDIVIEITDGDSITTQP